MGSISPDDGAYGEFDANPGINSDADNVLAIMQMNREAEERDRKLDIKGIDIPEEDDDILVSEFSDPTKDEGSDLLEANLSDKIKNFVDNLNADDLKGLGGKGSGPQALGSSGSLKGASAEGVTGARGFRGMESPYAAPKYYSPQGSVEFQKMVSGLLSDVFKTSIRKPTIRSLI
tara:strand:- start:660 stop:1184 length:525 start_codon:yes stop_codon:yes gene_type:complete